ncbi:MAG: M28 family peptidase [Leadbetterella sp.]
MKAHFLAFTLTLFSFSISGQKFSKTPESKLVSSDLEAEIRFFASDEMLGRKTGSVTNHVAARYIAEEFRAAGVKMVPGQNDYLQKVYLEKISSIKIGTITSNLDTLQIVKNFVAFGGSDNLDLKSDGVVFAKYGWKDPSKNINDYKDLNVKGKIVITRIGNEDSKTPQDYFNAITAKRKFAKEEGAIAIIEIFTAAIPWPTVANYFSGENVNVINPGPETRLPAYWISAASAKNWNEDKLKNIQISIPKRDRSPIFSNNIVGIVEGSDPVLKNEYVILSAHYDHIGHGASAGKITPEDTIFNGTRDNAFGTISVLNAARSFAKTPAKRSILLIAFTGEEMGLLGSKYYSENPLIPLKNCIYNLNCDGAGYTSTDSVTIFGLGRTGADEQLYAAGKALKLTVADDPAPEQGLFDRSDNVSFAAKGIPAPTLSPGFAAFDDRIFKYYHQAADNPTTISYDYLKKYAQMLIYSGRLIANRATAPQWKSGDKYEVAGKALYGR